MLDWKSYRSLPQILGETSDFRQVKNLPQSDDPFRHGRRRKVSKNPKQQFCDSPPGNGNTLPGSLKAIAS